MKQSRLTVALVLFPIFFGAALAVNYPGLRAPMMYDSRGCIEESRSVFDAHGMKGAVSVMPQRPLPMITFYLNYLAGGMEPTWFRVVNLAMLAVVGVIVAILVDLVLCLSAGAGRAGAGPGRAISVFLGLLFVMHPLQIYVTLYIWQRTALMACLFYYASFGLYLAARADLLRGRPAWYAVCVALFLCALLSKENSFTLPFMLLIAEAALFHEKWSAVASRAVVFGLILIACVGLAGMLQHPHGKEHLGAGIVDVLTLYYHESGMTPVEVLLTQCRVLFRYLFMILVPLPSFMLLTSPQVLSRSLQDPVSTLPAVIGVAALIALGIYLLKKRPVSGLGILFFLVNIVPEGVLVPQYSFFAYRAVLPMFGLLLVAADGANLVAKGLMTRPDFSLERPVLVALAAGGLLFAAGVTSIRATIWSDGIHFWREAVNNLPPLDGRVERLPAVQALSNLGLALMSKRRYLEAAQAYENVLKLEPHDPRKRVVLAAAYAELGKTDEAEALFREALTMEPDYLSGLVHYGAFLIGLHRDKEAVTYLQKAAALAPGDAVVTGLLEKATRAPVDRR